MKRFAVWVGLAIAGIMAATTPAHASVNDFQFRSFTADYYLGADSAGRSTLKTVEKLTAQFPSFDQNHGIERAIPKSYDGHSTSLHIDSVTDESGTALTYETSDNNDTEVLRIGDKDSYVHGARTYVITYSQRDVTKYFADTADDEFYWDTNGTQWQQPFGEVVATVHLSSSILPTFTKKLACYQGAQGAKRPCSISETGGVISAKASNLAAGENMTLVAGFTPGTFRGYEPSLWDRIVTIWVASLFVTSLIGLIAIFWLTNRYNKASNRTSELKPIPTEYIPPKNTSVLTASQIGDDTRSATTAQIMDLAVRHMITISQTSEKALWEQAEYELEIVKPVDDLLQEERDFVQTLFGGTAVGTVLKTKTLKDNYTTSSRLQKNTIALVKMIKGEYKLRQNNDKASRSFKKSGTVLLVASIVTLSPLLLIAAIVAYVCGWQLRPLTDKGLALRRYLAGLKFYIELAEKDRIKLLQSPEGAEKTGVSVKNGADKQLIRLYERVLPYAVLFGQEKEWNKLLAIRYDDAGLSPDWYVGQSAFNAVIFTSAMNDFSTSMNSYGTSTSSSSGGSSGGGSSGGGGGGGGGGGW